MATTRLLTLPAAKTPPSFRPTNRRRPTIQMIMNQRPIKQQNPRHFVLVHGACHGAWCWYKVSEGLTKAGHKVTAVDLAASGLDPRNVEDVGSVVEYSEPLISFLDSVPGGDVDEKVVVVAHSLGGYSLCVAMEMFPEKIDVGVFVIASMLGPEFTYKLVAKKYAELAADYMDTKLIFGNGLDKPPTAALLGPKYMETTSYRKSPREDLELGIKLIRPTPIFDQDQAEKDTTVTRERFGTVPRAFVVCDEEESGTLQWWQIKNNPPDDYVVIEGSDHMVMFSKPGPLVDYLLKLGAKYNSSTNVVELQSLS
ncbi:Methyl jasmonate esterase 1 [Linum perenne]